MIRSAILLLIIHSLAAPSSARLVFLGFNSEADDFFTVGLLDPLAAGTTLRFRDDEWDGAAFNNGAPSDNYFSFSLSTPLAAGTILNFNRVNYDATRNVTDGNGAPVSGVFGGPYFELGYLPLVSNDEGLYAYLGPDFDTVETPLASLRTDVAGGQLFGASVDFAGTPGQDGKSLVYVGPVSVDGPYSLFESLVADPSNWANLSASIPNTLSPYTPPNGMLIASVPEIGGGIAFTLLASVWVVRSSTCRRGEPSRDHEN